MPAGLNMITFHISQLTSVLHSMDTVLHPQLQSAQILVETHISNLCTILFLLVSKEAFNGVLHNTGIIRNLWFESKICAPTFLATLQTHRSPLMPQVKSINTGLCSHLHQLQAAIQADISHIQSVFDQLPQLYLKMA